MASKRVGKSTLQFGTPPVVLGYASVAGKKEGEGPLGARFDAVYDDAFFGKESWEKAECFMQQETLKKAVLKAGLTNADVGCAFGGDLLNQCISSSFSMRGTTIPFLGLYGACSTMAESLLLAAVMVDGGYSDVAAGITSSHFCTAERQYRMPLEYGGQRAPGAQWTATAAGAVILGSGGMGPRITKATIGCVEDMGLTDVNDMGAAMAPAAYSTLKAFFDDTGTTSADYDLIVTGDLGSIGKTMVEQLFMRDGVTLHNYTDCGMILFSAEQDVHAGGSGCGCSAAVLCAKLLDDMKEGKLKKLILAGTGALHSPISTAQKETIPGICHLVLFEM